MTAVVQYRGRGSVCSSCAWFAPGLRQGLRKVCARFALGLREMWFLRQGCLTVCDQGESSRTGSKRKLVAIVDGLAAGSPYSLCVYHLGHFFGNSSYYVSIPDPHSENASALLPHSVSVRLGYILDAPIPYI